MAHADPISYSTGRPWFSRVAKNDNVCAPIMRGVPMLKKAAIVLATICFYPFPAKSQDALGTFMFLFVASDFDVSHDYGKELIREPAFSGDRATMGRQTISIVENCVFEVKVEGKDMHGEGAPKDLRVADVMRWNFNKAFFDETELKGPDGDQQFIIHGDNGLIYHGLLCLSDARTCNFGSGYRGERQSNKFVQRLSKPNDRAIKAMKYFVKNICPGIKRKTAF